jgi:hypothetical protein
MQARFVASSFETRYALLRMRVWQKCKSEKE